MAINDLSPHNGEDVAEEITWQDDENRATLFLRSAFVLLSGALILGAQSQVAFHGTWLGVLYQSGINFVLSVCIIWFFFGQGLRPVEWLSDQKYNAWNYGIHFKEWKLHLKWALAICFCVAGLALLLKWNILMPQSKEISLGLGNDWSSYIKIAIMAWLIGCSLVWLFLGYLLFGMAQGFTVVGAILGIILAPILALAQYFTTLSHLAELLPALPFLLLVGICWRTKSIAPALYAVLMIVPLVMWILG